MKRNDLKNAIFRKIVGSILSSDLTSKDIEYFANDLIHSHEFAFELGHALRMSLQILDGEARISSAERFEREPSWLINMTERIQEKRISKKEILDAIPSNLSINFSSSSLMRMSMSDLLLKVFENAPQNTVSAFMRRIGIDEEQDPYLAGIDKKR